jgi:hypothetical protein
MAGWALITFGSTAALAWMVVNVLARAARAAWKRAMHRLTRHALHAAAKDAGITPALLDYPWEPAPEPDSPRPGWMSTDTPSPAEDTMYRHLLTDRDLVRPLKDRRRQP